MLLLLLTESTFLMIVSGISIKMYHFAFVHFSLIIFMLTLDRFNIRSWCSSHGSATATCEQSRPKQGERKDQASDTYKWLPCTWK